MAFENFMRMVLERVDKVYAKCGLKLNWAPGKSEVLAVFAGKGTYLARDAIQQYPDGLGFHFVNHQGVAAMAPLVFV